MYIMRIQLLHLFFFFFLSIISSEVITDIDDEILGMIAFKSSLTDRNGALSAWRATDDTPCSWPYVQCDAATSRVLLLSLESLSLSGAPLFRGLDRLQFLQSLSLSNNNLSGALLPGLSLLPRLKVLDLSKNFFSGRLPEDLGTLPSLRSLDLSDNALSGPIPDSLLSPAACSSLRYLSLSNNRLEGPMPSALSQCRFLLNLNLSNNQLSGSPDFANGLWTLSRLRVLDLSNNSLSGPLGEGIANLHHLKTLLLSGNRFSGNIPIGIGLCPHLSTVNLSDNSFDGAIPYTMRNLFSLSFLGLSKNRLSGDFPTWVSSLSNLQQLDLSRNKLTGEIPESLANLKDLTRLTLSDNSLTGEIPVSLAECAKLTEMRLDENELNGSIPRALFDLGLEVLDLSSNKLVGFVPPVSSKLSQTIRVLDLSNNGLTGVTPAEMALFFNLRYLNLSWNGLRSQLPPELGYFKNLSVLDLRRNEFSGKIPGDLCDSGSLSVLQLDGNSLTGSIPEEIANCSSLYLLSLSHNALTGRIPEAVATLKKLEVLNLEFNSLSGEIPQQLGTLNNLLAVNISHNQLIGRLPEGGIFQSLDQSSLQGNLGLCSPLVKEPCKMNVPKPLVLDPNEFNNNYNNGNLVTVPIPTKPRHKKFFSISTLIAISAAFVIALGVLAVTLLNLSARRRLGLLENALGSTCSSSANSSTPAVGKTVLFGPKSNLTAGDLVSAESLLCKAVEIGRGAFGTVYRSSIGEGRVVAIKKLLTPNIVPFHEDFDREVRILAKARHPNLMPVKGYYWTPQLQLLISEFADNGSLQTRLHGSKEPFFWASRFNVALGTAKGLAYLQSFRPPIVHYNIKPSNILLDGNLAAMVSDFGLARLLPKLEKHIMSSRFQSAMGYVAPELACQSLRINEKCDVYAFGVVVLELVTGRKPVEYGEDDVMILIDTVRVMLDEGNALDCVDSRMGEFPEEEVLPVLKLGLVCTSQIPSSRPTMAEVVQILQVIKTQTVVEGMEAF